MTQAAFGEAAGIDQTDVSRYELGKDAPPEKSLRRMADVTGVPWPVVVHLRRFHTALAAAKERWRAQPAEPRPALVERAVLETVLLAVAPYLAETEAAEPAAKTAEEERREAEEIRIALESFPPARRRRLLELAPHFSSL